MNDNYKILSKHKMLCFSKKYYLFTSGCKLFYAKNDMKKEEYLGNVPVGLKKLIFSCIRILARITRYQIRCGVFINDDIAIVSGFGFVFRVNIEKKEIIKEHRFRKNMNNVLSFTRVEGVPGFQNSILYGEYINDEKTNAIHIFGRGLDDNEWREKYCFSEGVVKHIHALIPSVENKCVYILTGDSDSESGIWEARNDFKNVRLLIGGSQKYRSCLALPTRDGILYITDAPDYDNYLMYYSFETQSVEKIKKISGPCIYGKIIDSRKILFSSSVEPSSVDRNFLSWFTYKKGNGVKDCYSHIYIVDNNKDITEVLSQKKDILPMKICGFGTFQFPNGDSPRLIATGQAIRKIDGKTIEIKHK